MKIRVYGKGEWATGFYSEKNGGKIREKSEKNFVNSGCQLGLIGQWLYPSSDWAVAVAQLGSGSGYIPAGTVSGCSPARIGQWL